MIRPVYLKQGDTISVVAPGRKIKKTDVDQSSSILRSWGLEVISSNHMYSEAHSYLAGTDQQRLQDFQTAMDNQNVSAIICARGGYGSSRFVDALDFTKFKQHPKWIIGFSDITSIHLKLFSLGYQSIHGTMPILFKNPEWVSSIESLRKVLFGEQENFVFPSNENNRRGNAEAQIVGGNLSLIVDSIGTKSEPDLNGKILIVEEVDEYLYKIDRMFTQLKRSNKLTHLKGLIVGHFSDIKDTELSFGETVEEIILNSINAFDFPVSFGFPSGHENPNLAWRSGAVAKLEVREDQSHLSFNH